MKTNGNFPAGPETASSTPQQRRPICQALFSHFARNPLYFLSEMQIYRVAFLQKVKPEWWLATEWTVIAAELDHSVHAFLLWALGFPRTFSLVKELHYISLSLRSLNPSCQSDAMTSRRSPSCSAS